MPMLKAEELRFDYTYEDEAPQIVLRGVNYQTNAEAFMAELLNKVEAPTEAIK